MEKGNFVEMQGKEVYRFAVDKVPRSIEALFEKLKLKKKDIDYIFAHQANKRILEQVSQKLSLGMDKFKVNVNEYGNTSADFSSNFTI